MHILSKLMISTAACALLAACTQPSTMVEYKGEQFYGKQALAALEERNHARRNQYADNSYTNDNTYVAAAQYTNDRYNSTPTYTERYQAYAPASGGDTSVSSIGVSDLPPPTAKNVIVQNNDRAQPVELFVEDIASTQGKPSFVWPVQGHVIKPYGAGIGDARDGINISAPAGEPVYAVADGNVVYAGDSLKAFGNMALLKHQGRTNSMYGHLSHMIVGKGDKVQQGDIIGYVGTSGSANEPQLHFALREGKTALNPEKHLSRTLASY